MGGQAGWGLGTVEAKGLWEGWEESEIGRVGAAPVRGMWQVAGHLGTSGFCHLGDGRGIFWSQLWRGSSSPRGGPSGALGLRCQASSWGLWGGS